jgi:uncharacterized protein YndB with AHSA1/START domain
MDHTMTDEATSNLHPFTVRQTIAAPPVRVFDAWTDPAQISRWFVPVDGWSAPLDLISVDARTGGSWRVSMVDDKGEAFPAVFHHREVDRPNRLVFTTGAPDHDPNDPDAALLTVSLEDRDGATELTFQGTTTDPDLQEAAGWTAMFERMADQLASD